MGSHGENHRHSVGARRVRAVPRCHRGRGRGVGRCGTRGGCTCCPDGRLPARGDHRGADMRVGAGEVASAWPGGVLRCEFVCSGGAISASRRCVRVAPIRAGAAAVARGADCFAIARRAHGGRACVSGTELACVGALSALAALLSWRTSMLLAQRDLRHRTRDEFRAHELFGAEGSSGVVAADGCSEPSADAVSECAVADVDAAARSPEGRCRAAFSELTEREYEVVRLVAEGLDNHEISAAAFISEGTVRNRISSVLQKTGHKNRTQLAVAWWQARER